MKCGQTHADLRVSASRYKPCKALLGAAALVSLMCLWLLVLGITAEDGHDRVVAGGHRVMLRSGALAESLKLQAAEQDQEDQDRMRQYHHAAAAVAAGREVDINYMSKRRVPNGADPIHNRRAGKSRRPPGKI